MRNSEAFCLKEREGEKFRNMLEVIEATNGDLGVSRIIFCAYGGVVLSTRRLNLPWQRKLEYIAPRYHTWDERDMPLHHRTAPCHHVGKKFLWLRRQLKLKKCRDLTSPPRLKPLCASWGTTS